ncbi:hypothetical protein EGI16_07730 [Chryseobacterium sp. G0240]|uniref:hypothetical protein n=1 Tax=Chryseobacterium sp. G0240 TaxID=2487066 RepID=UPI000F44A45B|nr:hypothetical protein [Chryseobacterium sp. G0240]ROI04549.1 hypothetical protein EGI16_07730 [Chryseobacterium sp. G0240]
METTDISQIKTLFQTKTNYDDNLILIIFDYLNQITKFKYILISKIKTISIYKTQSEINIDSKINGYENLLNNLSNYDDENIIISNFNYKNNDITIFISSKMDEILGILNQKIL